VLTHLSSRQIYHNNNPNVSVLRTTLNCRSAKSKSSPLSEIARRYIYLFNKIKQLHLAVVRSNKEERCEIVYIYICPSTKCILHNTIWRETAVRRGWRGQIQQQNEKALHHRPNQTARDEILSQGVVNRAARPPLPL
jgi:hypothetical protein